jgi:hypothetical protein
MLRARAISFSPSQNSSSGLTFTLRSTLTPVRLMIADFIIASLARLECVLLTSAVAGKPVVVTNQMMSTLW